jgi:cytochrome P450
VTTARWTPAADAMRSNARVPRTLTRCIFSISAAPPPTLTLNFLEALRLQPQGEVLLRTCARDGAQIADSCTIPAGTPVFVSHGSAMRDIPEPDAFILTGLAKTTSSTAGLGTHASDSTSHR